MDPHKIIASKANQLIHTRGPAQRKAGQDRGGRQNLVNKTTNVLQGHGILRPGALLEDICNPDARARGKVRIRSRHDMAPHKRLRKVIGRSGTFRRTAFFSVKMKRPIHCEGDNERNAVAILEAHPWVLAYREQSLDLTVEIDGKPRTVYPDFEVQFDEGEYEIVEIKRAAQLALPAQRDRHRAIGAKVRELGCQYRIWTDVEIRRQPRLDTANLICWRGRGSLSESLVADVARIAPTCLTVGDLKVRAVLGDDEICALALQRHLAVDINARFDDAMPILNREMLGGNSHAFL